MPYTFLTKVAAGSATSSNVTTGTQDTTGADLLVVCVSDFGGGAPAVITDSKGNVWNALTLAQTGSAARARIWWSTPSSVGTGHTATATSTGQFPAIDFRAYSGSALLPFDVENGGASASVSVRASGAVVPSQDGSLIVSCAAADTSTGLTVNSGLGNLTNVNSSANNEGLGAADIIQTVGGSVTATWTNSGLSNMAVVIAVFKPLAGRGNMFLVF